ncbi:MAG: DUF1800 domain-containing protein [Planctomycetota bacterium]|nr:DUF1800 domain-containing protein [Planctomycetota bacterium]
MAKQGLSRAPLSAAPQGVAPQGVAPQGVAPQGSPPPSAAISPGGGGNLPNAGPGYDLAPWRPSATDKWDWDKAAHLLRRAGFGGTPEEIEAAVALGMDRTVDILVTPSTTGLQEYGSRVLPHGEALNLTYDLNGQRAQWLYEMAYSFYPLKEKMALFWHDHWSVGIAAGTHAPLLNRHINLFRQHGLGKFRNMVLAVTKDPAMLRWLDNYINGRKVGGKPTLNENYGRELLELYTMGVDNGYTQDDVEEASKCLTGWSMRGYNSFYYNRGYHIAGAKTVLGKKISNGNSGNQGMQDAYDLVDVILGRLEPAEFLCDKIWRYFVNEAPPPATLALLATRFRQDGYDIRSLMNAVLRSNIFYAKGSRRSLIKNPVEYVVGSIRNTGLTPLARWRLLGARVEAAGYPLLRYTSPAGLDDGKAWIDTAALISRMNWTNELTQVSTTAGTQNRFNFGHEILRKNLTTDVQIVDHYLSILVDGDAPAKVRTDLIDFMNRIDSGPRKFSISNQNIVNGKVRGLVHLIQSLPEYQIN